MTGKSFFTVEIPGAGAISSRDAWGMPGMEAAAKEAPTVRDLGRAKRAVAIAGFVCLAATTQLACNGCGGGTLTGTGGAGIIHAGVAGGVGSGGITGNPGAGGGGNSCFAGAAGSCIPPPTYDCGVPEADAGTPGTGGVDPPSLGLIAPLSYPNIAPTNVVLADVTGDGRADLVTVDAEVLVRVNDGTGRLGPPREEGVATAQGAPASAVVAGDLNGDGHPDLVYGHSTQSPGVAITIRLGDGDGGFAPPVDYPIEGVGSAYLALADLDRDGRADIVAFVPGYGQTSEIDALMNAGDGTFTPTVKYRNAGEAAGVAAADLDGDGFDDLVVSAYSGDSVNVFWNRDGVLVSPARIPAGVHPASVSIGDVDNDGHLDIVVVNQVDASGDASVVGGVPATVSVLRNDGHGSFDAPVAYEVGVGAWWGLLADLDGNGGLDITVVNATEDASVLFNNGLGGFSEALRFGVGGEPIDVRAGEMNGDGRPDLVFINNTRELVVALTTAEGALTPIGAPIDYPTGRAPDTATLVPTTAAAIAAGDIDGDGKVDLVATGTLPYDEGMKALFNRGSGTFGNPVRLDITYVAPGTLAIADLNGDVTMDLISGNQYPCVSITSRGGSSTTPRCYMDGADGHPMSLALGDIDGDARIDLAVVRASGTRILTNNVNGIFTETDQLGGISAPRVSATLADLNGDGRAELLIASGADPGTTGSVALFINDGSGHFPTQTFFNAGSSPSAIAVADLNGDRWPDIAVANSRNTTCSGAQGTIDILFGDGTGGFRGAVRTGGGGYETIAAADMDGDGDVDLVALDEISHEGGWTQTSRVNVFVNDGSGRFAGPLQYATGSDPTSMIVQDLNGDGRPDIAVATSRGAVSVLLNGPSSH
jgi:hypothetical protein